VASGRRVFLEGKSRPGAPPPPPPVFPHLPMQFSFQEVSQRMYGFKMPGSSRISGELLGFRRAASFFQRLFFS